MCDGCPRSFHLFCVGLSATPDEEWYCEKCQRGRGRRQGDGLRGGGGDGRKEASGGGGRGGGGGGRRRQVVMDDSESE